MYNQQKTLAFLVSIFWIIASLNIFSQITVVSMDKTYQNVFAMLAIGIPVIIIFVLNKIPATTRAGLIAVLTISFSIIISYQDRRFLFTPLIVATLAIALTMFYSERLLVIAGVAGNIACIGFYFMFPSISLEIISKHQIINLFILMDVVVVSCYVIVDWIKKQIKHNEEIASEADKASHAKGEFLAMVNHEIRTPMNAIFGMTEIILSAPQDTGIDELKSNAALIRTTSYELLGLVNNILDISKIEKGKMDLVETPYNALRMFLNVKDLAFSKLANKDITLRTNFDFWISDSLVGDDVRIEQICINIIDSFLKYRVEGFLELDVRQSATSCGVDLIIMISDTGTGMKEDERKALLSDYQDAGVNHNMDGISFGPAITKSLVDLMGGTIQVKSVCGIGTTFAVIIPQKIAEEQASDNEHDTAAGKFKIKGASVLIVDDNKTNIQIIKAILKSYNIDADTASSGEQAVLKATDNRYDVIFMDHIMPGMDGVEATKIIRELGGKGSGEVPIIAFTANNDRSIEKFFLANGFNAYITKPMRLARLELLLKTFLSGKMIDSAQKSDDLDSIGSEMWIAGVDVLSGIENCGGTVSMFMDVLKIFYTSGLSQLETIRSSFNNGDMYNVAIEVHSLKSIAKNIGAVTLGEMAEIIEIAARKRDWDLMNEHIGNMLSEYRRILDGISVIVDAKKQDAGESGKTIDQDELISKLKQIIKSSQDYLFIDASNIVDELLGYSYEPGISDVLNEIKSNISQFSYANTIASAQELLSALEGK